VPPAPWAAVLLCPAGMGALAGGGAARRKTGGVGEVVISNLTVKMVDS